MNFMFFPMFVPEKSFQEVEPMKFSASSVEEAWKAVNEFYPIGGKLYQEIPRPSQGEK